MPTGAVLFFTAITIAAERPAASLGTQAAALATSLATACPVAAYDDVTAFRTCPSR